MKKLSAFLVVAILFFVLLAVLLFSTVPPEDSYIATEDAMYDYLVEAGYPEPIIESLTEEAIYEIYTGGYQYQSSDVVYGILTEGYSITYEKDIHGNIVIDAENLQKFNQLLTDAEVVEKIKSDKATAFAIREAAQLRQDYYMSNLEPTATCSQRDATILSLTNWYATLTVSKITQTNSYLKKGIAYAWNWYYSPVCNFVDKAAVAWSKDFTLDPASATWAYKAWGDFGMNVTGGSRYETRTWSGTGCTSYEPDCGFGQEIDIVFDFEKDGWTFRSYEHGGSITGKISRYLIGDEQGQQNIASAVGCYYHSTLGLDGELQLSGSPSIGISLAATYDRSPDTGTQFNFYAND